MTAEKRYRRQCRYTEKQTRDLGPPEFPSVKTATDIIDARSISLNRRVTFDRFNRRHEQTGAVVRNGIRYGRRRLRLSVRYTRRRSI